MSQRVDASTTTKFYSGTALMGALPELKDDTLGFVERMLDVYRDVVTFPIGPPGPLRIPMTLVMDPDGVEHVFGASTMAAFRKEGGFYREIRSFFGDGLLTSQDDDWRRQKRFVQPVFTHARVEGYLAAMSREAGRSVDELAGRVGSGWAEVDIGDAMAMMTLRIVGTALFGEDIDEVAPSVHAHVPVLQEAVTTRGRAAVPLPRSVPTPANRRGNAAQTALVDLCDEIVARRRAGAAAGGRGDDLLGLLIDAHDGDEHLSDAEVREQVLVFLLAGHETTSMTLLCTLHLLAHHPEIQARVRDEVSAVLGDRDPTVDDVHSGLPVTSAVLKESLRLYPAAPIIGRQAMTDDEICGQPVRGGTIVAVAPWAVHRRPDLWPDASGFDPDRWLTGPQDRHRYAWLPFGGGPRACIGQHFAVQEATVALAMLVRALSFAPRRGDSDVLDLLSQITLSPRHPVRLVVTRA